MINYAMFCHPITRQVPEKPEWPAMLISFRDAADLVEVGPAEMQSYKHRTRKAPPLKIDESDFKRWLEDYNAGDLDVRVEANGFTVRPKDAKSRINLRRVLGTLSYPYGMKKDSYSLGEWVIWDKGNGHVQNRSEDGQWYQVKKNERSGELVWVESERLYPFEVKES